MNEQDFDAMIEADAKLRFERHQNIVPQCCEDMRGHEAVILQFTGYSLAADGKEWPPPSQVPVWLISVSIRIAASTRDYYEAHGPPVAKFCPFCGTKTPAVKRKEKPPEPICTITDGGYYCNTCSERLNACTCYRPEAAWEPIPPEPNPLEKFIASLPPVEPPKPEDKTEFSKEFFTNLSDPDE